MSLNQDGLASSTTVRAVLLDDESLARLARTTLAGSDQATLVVADGGP